MRGLPPATGSRDRSSALSVIALRQEYVRRLQAMVPTWRRHVGAFVNMLRLLRGVSVDVVEAIVAWRSGGVAFPFLFEGENYLIRMLRDTDFLADVPQLSARCSVAFACNPLFEPLPLLTASNRPPSAAARAEGDATAASIDATSTHAGVGPAAALRCSASMRKRIAAARRALQQEWHVQGDDAATLVLDRVRAKLAAAVGEGRPRTFLSRSKSSTRAEFERNVRIRGVHLLPLEWAWLHARAETVGQRDPGVDHRAVQRFLQSGSFDNATKRSADALRVLMKPLQLPDVGTEASKHVAQARAKQLKREVIRSTATVRAMSRKLTRVMAESSIGATGGGDATVDDFSRRVRAQRLAAAQVELERERREAGAVVAALAQQRRDVKKQLVEWDTAERVRYAELEAELLEEEAHSGEGLSPHERITRFRRSVARTARVLQGDDAVAAAARTQRAQERVEVSTLAQRAAGFRDVLHRKVTRRAGAKASRVASRAARAALHSADRAELAVLRLRAMLRHPNRAARGVLRLGDGGEKKSFASRASTAPEMQQLLLAPEEEEVDVDVVEVEVGVEVTTTFAPPAPGAAGGATGTVQLVLSGGSGASRAEGGSDLRLVRVAVCGHRALRLTLCEADVLHAPRPLARVLDLTSIAVVLRGARRPDAATLTFDRGTLDTITRQTRLGEVPAADVFEVLMGYIARTPASERGRLPMSMTLPSFISAMASFTRPGIGSGGRRALRLALDRLYASFDVDGNGLVDAVELAAGLAELAAESEESRTYMTFRMFCGAGGEEVGQEQEPTHATIDSFEAFLRSVYGRLYAALPRYLARGVAPAECAQRAAHAAACTAFPKLMEGGAQSAAKRKSRHRRAGTLLRFPAFVHWLAGPGRELGEVAMHLHERPTSPTSSTSASRPSSRGHSASGKTHPGSGSAYRQESIGHAAAQKVAEVDAQDAAQPRVIVHLTPPPASVLAALAAATSLSVVEAQTSRLTIAGLQRTTVWRGAASFEEASLDGRPKLGECGKKRKAALVLVRLQREHGRDGALRLGVHDPLRPSPARSVAAEFLAWASPSSAKGASLRVALDDVQRLCCEEEEEEEEAKTDSGGLKRKSESAVAAAMVRWVGLRRGDAADVRWLLRHLVLQRASSAATYERIAALVWR